MIEKKIIFTTDNTSPRTSYIHLKESLSESRESESVEQIVIDSKYKNIQGGDNFKGEIIIDIDKDGNIVGIEILGDVIPKKMQQN